MPSTVFGVGATVPASSSDRSQVSFTFSAPPGGSVMMKALVQDSRDLGAGVSDRGLDISLRTTANIEGELSFYPSHTATPATVTLSLGALSATLIVSLRARTRVQC